MIRWFFLPLASSGMVFAYRVYKHVYGHVYGLWFSVLYLPFLNPDTTYDTASLRTQRITARAEGAVHVFIRSQCLCPLMSFCGYVGHMCLVGHGTKLTV